MTLSVRLSEAEAAVIRKYAEIHSISVSDLVRQALIDRIEDEFDLGAYDKAMQAYRKNPVTYSLDEVEKELGLS